KKKSKAIPRTTEGSIRGARVKASTASRPLNLPRARGKAVISPITRDPIVARQATLTLTRPARRISGLESNRAYHRKEILSGGKLRYAVLVNEAREDDEVPSPHQCRGRERGK